MIEYQLIGHCKSFSEVPSGAQILFVNGKCVIGHCEGCGKPILETPEYQSGPEGEMVCKKCGGGDK